MNDRRRMLLAIAATLAVARLVVVPWVEAQGAARERLQVLTQRLDRSAAVIGSREKVLAAREELRAATELALGPFPVADSVDAFRLDAQRQVAGIVESVGLQVSLFDWLLDGQVDKAGLRSGRIRLQVEGPVGDVARLHGELEGRLPFLAARDVQVNFQGMGPDLSEVRASLTLVADLYYREQAAK